MRIDEFKYIVTAEIENGMFQKGDIGGFSGSIVTDTGGAIMVNLYTDPQEDVNVGIRHIPMITLLGQEQPELCERPAQISAAIQDRLLLE